MKIEFVDALDIGNFGRQRLVFRVLEPCSLRHQYLLQGKNYLYSFPPMEVRAGELLVVYFKDGQQDTQHFRDATCHFFYTGKWIALVEPSGPHSYQIRGHK